MKLDMIKAFHNLQWSFLFKALDFFNFSQDWIRLIKELITTSKGFVLLNKSPNWFFPSSYGLRQGDPMSPYLFILAEEILNINVIELQREGKVKKISIVLNTPCLLLYADYLLFFARASLTSIKSIKLLLATCQLATGQFLTSWKATCSLANVVTEKNDLSLPCWRSQNALLPPLILELFYFLEAQNLATSQSFLTVSMRNAPDGKQKYCLLQEDWFW